jgi:peroxiredoxin
MGRLTVGDVAPDFALPNHAGALVRLADVLQRRHALLLFNLGFI